MSLSAFSLPHLPFSLPFHPHRPALTRRLLRPFANSLRPTLSTISPPPPPPKVPTKPFRPDPNDDDSNIPQNPLSLYLTLLSTRPLLTKVITSALLTALSDLLAQTLSNSTSLNLRRLLTLFLTGGCLTAPMFHYLYLYLESILPLPSVKNLLLQLLIDQVLAAPIWLVLYLTLTTTLQTLPSLTRKPLRLALTRDFTPALLLTWSIFPPVQLFSFALLPARFRLLVLNLVDLAYTAVLSYLQHRPHPALVPVAYMPSRLATDALQVSSSAAPPKPLHLPVAAPYLPVSLPLRISCVWPAVEPARHS